MPAFNWTSRRQETPYARVGGGSTVIGGRGGTSSSGGRSLDLLSLGKVSSRSLGLGASSAAPAEEALGMREAPQPSVARSCAHLGDASGSSADSLAGMLSPTDLSTAVQHRYVPRFAGLVPQRRQLPLLTGPDEPDSPLRLAVPSGPRGWAEDDAPGRQQPSSTFRLEVLSHRSPQAALLTLGGSGAGDADEASLCGAARLRTWQACADEAEPPFSLRQACADEKEPPFSLRQACADEAEPPFSLRQACADEAEPPFSLRQACADKAEPPFSLRQACADEKEPPFSLRQACADEAEPPFSLRQACADEKEPPFSLQRLLMQRGMTLTDVPSLRGTAELLDAARSPRIAPALRLDGDGADRGGNDGDEGGGSTSGAGGVGGPASCVSTPLRFGCSQLSARPAGCDAAFTLPRPDRHRRGSPPAPSAPRVGSPPQQFNLSSCSQLPSLRGIGPPSSVRPSPVARKPRPLLPSGADEAAAERGTSPLHEEQPMEQPMEQPEVLLQQYGSFMGSAPSPPAPRRVQRRAKAQVALPPSRPAPASPRNLGTVSLGHSQASSPPPPDTTSCVDAPPRASRHDKRTQTVPPAGATTSQSTQTSP